MTEPPEPQTWDEIHDKKSDCTDTLGVGSNYVVLGNHLRSAEHGVYVDVGDDDWVDVGELFRAMYDTEKAENPEDE
jgi:hypothetical protein